MRRGSDFLREELEDCQSCPGCYQPVYEALERP
jgi:hypothetical protein